MLIGLITDTHDEPSSMRKAVDAFTERDVDWVIHCGDITTPPLIDLLSPLKDKTVYGVYGNCDTARDELQEAFEEVGELKGDIFPFTVDGLKYVAYHGTDAGIMMALSEDFGLVFHGHTHKREDKVVDSTRYINPGACQDGSAAIFDTETQEVEFIDL